MHKIQGHSLLGFGDFFSGFDEIGAADRGYGSEIGAAKKPASKPAAPGSRPVRPYPKPARTQAMQKHGKVLKAARDVATKAAKTIGMSMHLLSQKPPAVTAKPMSAKASAVVRALPGRAVHVGADVAAKMTPKQQAAVAKHNAAVAKARDAAKVLAQHAVKTRDAVKVLAKKMVAQKKTSKLLRTPLNKRGSVNIGAMLANPETAEATAELLQEYYDAVGATPDPANPGSLTDGSPDPAAAPAAAPSGADLGIPADTAGDVVDSGAELPAPPPMDVFIADMATVGGIAYDGSKGTPNGFAGSYGLMTKDPGKGTGKGGSVTSAYGTATSYSAYDKTDHYGYVWGSFDQDNVPNGIPYGGQAKENAWNHIHGSEQGPGTSGWQNVAELGEVIASNTKISPNGMQYGPIVGNPGMPDFKGMRMDGKGTFFWLPQEAPDWLTFPIKQAAALTAQAAAKAEAEAAKAAAAAETKARADEAAAKAAQDAANALAESAAASTQKIAKGEEEVKQATETTAQAQQETEAQRGIVKQQAEDTAAQAVETEQTKQAGAFMIQQATEQAAQDKQIADMLIERAKQEQAYYAAHPEEMPDSAAAPGDEDQQMAEGEPPLPGMEDGGGEGEYDDGAPVPGGDLMRDEAGEGYEG